jgi:hypothetical protein
MQRGSAKPNYPITPVRELRKQTGFARMAPSPDAVAELFYRELFARKPWLRELFKTDLAKEAEMPSEQARRRGSAPMRR